MFGIFLRGLFKKKKPTKKQPTNPNLLPSFENKISLFSVKG